MTVLVLTEQSDVTADTVVDSLNQRDVPVFRCDTAEFPQRLSLSAGLDGSGRWNGVLRNEHREVDLAKIRSVWYRRPTAFELPPGLSEPESRLAAHEARFGLGGVLGSLDTLWVNHPGREADASYKPAQLAIAAQCGLAVPATLVTNDPEAVREFAGQVRGPLVCKMLGAAAFVEEGTPKIVYTRRLDSGDLADLEGVTSTAHLFQEFVTSDYAARVTVVGQECFPVAIYADSAEAVIDWRADYAALRYEPVDLPDSVRTGIMAFMQHFGLAFGAFDFGVRPSGDWVTYECNASGQFSWIEDETGLAISETLADVLAAGKVTR